MKSKTVKLILKNKRRFGSIMLNKGTVLLESSLPGGLSHEHINKAILRKEVQAVPGSDLVVIGEADKPAEPTDLNIIISEDGSIDMTGNFLFGLVPGVTLNIKKANGDLLESAEVEEVKQEDNGITTIKTGAPTIFETDEIPDPEVAPMSETGETPEKPASADSGDTPVQESEEHSAEKKETKKEKKAPAKKKTAKKKSSKK